VLAGEHRVDPLAQAALLGEPDEQPQRLVGDPVLRVVEADPLGLEREPLAAVGVAREEVAEMQVADLLVVPLQLPPGGCPCQGRVREGILP
jgi:hypothetical protein